jgi:hypothetical protein
MNQKEYRRMIYDNVLQPMLVHMVMEGIIEEFELEEDENDEQLTVIKLKTNRPEELTDIAVEDVETERNKGQTIH